MPSPKIGLKSGDFEERAQGALSHTQGEGQYHWLITGNNTKDSGGRILHARGGKTQSSAARPASALISLLLILGALVPGVADASVWTTVTSMFKGNGVPSTPTHSNLQTLDLPMAAMNINPAPATGGGGVTVVDSSALVPAEGPSGTIADIEKPKNGTISIYIVQQGDTLSGIAKMFGVSVGTILSANDIPRASALKVGQKLVILPITGISYTVKKGDTLASIAKKYGGDAQEIASYNELADSGLVVGDSIIIPNGEIQAPTPSKSSGSKVKVGAEPAHDVGPRGDASQIAYYIAPLSSYVETQGIHGYNGVDLAAPSGTPIMAAATGDVVVAKEGGWNGGYGSYVVISHGNGSQTLYAHMSSVSAYSGQHVVQGQVIGYVGRTGLATGSHLHFEIRNGIRNPF